MMNRSFLVIGMALLVACGKEFADKPAADVQPAGRVEQTATTSDTTVAQQVTSTAQVFREKSSIGFVGAKAVGQHEGVFQEFDGSIGYNGSTPVKIDFTIQPASVKTDSSKLDGHLKSADFFDVEKYPTATFTSSSITPAPPGSAGGATHTLTGILDLHGQKKNVTFPVKVEQSAEGVHATSEFTINRQEWGIAYKGAPDNLIKDEVLIRLNMWFPPAPNA